MYRAAAKRLLHHSLRPTPSKTTAPFLPIVFTYSPRNSATARFCTSDSSNLEFSPRNNPDPNPNSAKFDNTNKSEGFSAGDSKTTSDDAHRRKPGERRKVAEYQEEQARVLHASLRHVNRLGWTESALMAGAREVGISPSIVGSLPRKEAALVKYFMDECLERLIDVIEADEDLKNLIPSERVCRLVKARLEMQIPYISKWAQALSIQAMPTNVPTSFKQRAALIDEIWHAAGDDSSDLDWYVKRTVLGGIYSTTEVYMLTDNSPDFRDTWVFLAARVRDAFDLKKTLQEAQYLAEAVGAGLGGSLQGLVTGFKR